MMLFKIPVRPWYARLYNLCRYVYLLSAVLIGYDAKNCLHFVVGVNYLPSNRQNLTAVCLV